MTTVFTALPMPKGGSRLLRKPELFKSFLSLDGSKSTNTLTPVDDLPTDIDVVEPNLEDLNTALSTLVQIFPDVQPEVFREMLMNISKESRVEIVTEHLLKDKGKWVMGRYKNGRATKDDEHEKSLEDTKLSVTDTFRSVIYQQSVKQLFYQEFKVLSRSSIKAVLAEKNYSYTQARPILQQLASRSWRHYMTSFWSRKREVSDIAEHPLIEWRTVSKPTGVEQSRPYLRPTASHELNTELYKTLVVPVVAKQKQVVFEQDVLLALDLNEKEAEEAGAMFECECCYATYSFEQISTCDKNCHLICFTCIRHASNEALFGQGWARNVSTEKLSIRCLAPSVEECDGCIPTNMVKRALYNPKDGHQTWKKLENRIAFESMTNSKLPLLQCPFCPYAEVDEASQLRFRDVHAFGKHIIRLSRLNADVLFQSFLALLVYHLSLVVYPSIYMVLAFVSMAMPSDFAASRLRVTRRRRGLKFWCRSPECGLISCSVCSARWSDPHVCHETTTSSLRHAIEAATTTAVKRTCPKCQLSFVKSSGCNKLVCNCGYAMCYVCRNEIGKEGYGHFCQHFRALGGRCTECDRCDLYIVEDEEASIRRAADIAERDWREKEGKQELKSTSGFGVIDARGHRLALVREEVLSGIKKETRWSMAGVLDVLLEALSD